MKNIILLSLAIIMTGISFAQPPQGINYQAVAIGATGQPLTSRSISVRFSVLDSSSAGTAVYVETQSVTTDNSGLFSVILGNGTPVTGTFSGIDWAVNNKWLKSEMDTADASNYLLMGISQFMSVPYALYAGRSQSDYTSVDYPDGLLNATNVIIPKGQDYTVPTGKNLYVHTPGYVIVADADSIIRTANGGARRPLGLSDGQTINPQMDTITGILVNKRVNWVTQDITASPYTTPSGYDLIILSCTYYNNTNSFIANINIDGAGAIDRMDYGITIINSGHTVSNTSPSGAGHMYINGYLRPQ